MELPPSAAGLPAIPADQLPQRLRAAITGPVSGFFYDVDVAAGLARGLRDALPSWAEVFYAVKANSFPPILAALAPHVDGFEVASASEVELAGTARMVAAGPGKSLALLDHDDRARCRGDQRREPARTSPRQPRRRAGRAARAGGDPGQSRAGGRLRLARHGGRRHAVRAPGGRRAATRSRWRNACPASTWSASTFTRSATTSTPQRTPTTCAGASTGPRAPPGDFDLRVVDVGGGLGVPFEGGEPFDVARFGELLAGLTPARRCAGAVRARPVPRDRLRVLRRRGHRSQALPTGRRSPSSAAASTTSSCRRRGTSSTRSRSSRSTTGRTRSSGPR